MAMLNVCVQPISVTNSIGSLVWRSLSNIGLLVGTISVVTKLSFRSSSVCMHNFQMSPFIRSVRHVLSLHANFFIFISKQNSLEVDFDSCRGAPLMYRHLFTAIALYAHVLQKLKLSTSRVHEMGHKICSVNKESIQNLHQ